ncbi:MAG TPA: hypothetical protein VIL27_06780, partial [Clostridia bacterium]
PPCSMPWTLGAMGDLRIMLPASCMWSGLCVRCPGRMDFEKTRPHLFGAGAFDLRLYQLIRR